MEFPALIERQFARLPRSVPAPGTAPKCDHLQLPRNRFLGSFNDKTTR